VVATPGVAGLLTNTASVGASEIDLNPANNTASVVTTVGLPVADAGVTKTGPTNAIAGSNVTFTITITNHGPQTALNVVVTDALPAGMGVVSVTPSVGSATNLSGTVVASLGHLNAGASATVTIVAALVTTGTLTNIATVTTSSSDTNSANNSASAVIVVTAPAPKIVPAGAAMVAESISPANAVVDFGEEVTVSLALRNTGSASTGNLGARLLDGGGVTASSGLTNYYGALVAGGPSQAANFKFTAVGDNGGVVIATLQLSDGATDLGTVTFEFRLPATTSFTNSNAIAIPDHGGATPYPSTIAVSGLTGVVSKVTVALNGLTHAFPDDVDVLLVGPAGQRVVLMSDAGGGYSVTNVTLTLEDSALAGGLLPDATQINPGSYQPTDYESGDAFPPPAPAGAAGSALAAFNHTNPNGTWSLYVMDDATGDAGTIAQGWSLTLTTVNPVDLIADLAVTVSRTADPLYVGRALIYTIGVTNLGPSPATGVTVTDAVPAGLQLVSSSTSQGAVGSASNVVTATLGSLAPGTGAVVTIQTTPLLPGNFVNTAAAVANETDPALTNNSAQTSAVVNPAADLVVTVADAPDPLYVGATLTYTIGVTNLGPSPAAGVVVTDALPAGLNYNSASSSQGSVGAVGNLVTATLNNLAVGAVAVVTIQTTPTLAGNFVNAAGVAGNEADLNPANNSAQTSTLVNPLANLAVTITGTPAPLYVGGALVYTIGVTNLGPSPATGVTVTDTLPVGLSYVSSSASRGTIGAVGNLVTANVGTLAAGAGAVLTIQTTPTLASNFVNSASVTANEADLDLANNTAQTSKLVSPAADLLVTIFDAPDPLYVSNILTYTIGVTNLGPSPATGVTVTDTLPVGLSYVSGSSSQGTIGAVGNLVTASVGNLAVGAGAVLTIQTTPTQAGNFVNAASVTRNETDLNPANNTAQTSTLVNPLADLAVGIAATPAPFYVGGALIYTIGVTNRGPSPATGVTVTDTLPVGLSYVSSSSSRGTIGAVGNLVTANVGTLAAGAGAVLTIQTTPTQAGNFVNSASVTASEADLDLVNNTAQTSTLVSPAADLAVTVADAPDPLFIGGELIYTIAVSNLGPSAALVVTVTNTLSPGVSFVSATPSGYTLAGGVVTFTNLGNLGSGGTASATITVKPNAAGTLTNTTACDSGVTDLFKGNNTVSVTTVVEVLRLGVTSVGNDLVIAWPADATAYELESATNLTPAAVWTPVTSPPPVIAGGQKTVTISPVGSVMFFRLRATVP
jgi:uncharacterized repeat protein (TIGR01451 family)